MSNAPDAEQTVQDLRAAPPPPTAEEPQADAPAEPAPESKLQLYAVVSCVLCCFLGQIFIWIKEKSLTPTLNPMAYSATTLGSYAFMMFLSAIVNLLSLHKKQPWLYWATVAVALGVVLDMNICVADWLVDEGADMRKTSKSWNWELRVGYILSLIGYVGSFAAMPVDPAKINFGSKSTIVGVVLGLWLIAGNAAIWSNEGKTSDGSFVCPVGYKVEAPMVHTGLPLHVSRAFTTGVLHLLASLFNWEGGQWMTFIIACISIADYMPAGGGPGRCRNDDKAGCEVGVWFSFTGMWMVVLAHIFLKRGKLTPDVSKANPVAGVRPLFALLGNLMCLAGMVMVAVENHKKNDANKARFGLDVGTYKDAGAQETYDVFQTFVGALFIYWGYLAANNRVGVAGLCMHFGVVNRLLGATGQLDFIGACPYKWAAVPEGIHNNTDAVVRAGYILLLAGMLLAAFSLLNIEGVKADSSKAQIAGIFVLTCVTWLWSADKWYGQMGFTALLGAAFHTFDYKQGLDAVFFWVCLQLASQTPFTTCEGQGNFLAFVVTLATLGLFYLAYLHFDVRGDAKGEPEEDEAAEEECPVAVQEKAVDVEAKQSEEDMQH